MEVKSTSQHCAEYNALVDLAGVLCKTIPITDLFFSLISKRVIDIADKAEICSTGRSEAKMVEQFIEKYLHPELSVGETSRFRDFVSVLKGNRKCNFLVKKIEDRIAYHQSLAAGVLAVKVVSTSSNRKANEIQSDEYKEEGHYCNNKQGVKIESRNMGHTAILLLLFVAVVLLVYIAVQLRELTPIHDSFITCCQCTSNASEFCSHKMNQIHSDQEDEKINLLPSLDKFIEMSYRVAPVTFTIPNIFDKMINKESWISPLFFAFEEGYLMALKVYPGGKDESEGTHMAVILYLIKGPYDERLQDLDQWPLRGAFTIELLNQKYNFDHFVDILILTNETCSECVNRVKNGLIAMGYGSYRFISHNHNYWLKCIKDGNMKFRISYSSCYSCVYIWSSIVKVLLKATILSLLDGAATFATLISIEVVRGLRETSNFIFNLQIIVLKWIVLKNVFKGIVLLGLIVLADVLNTLLWEFIGIISYEGYFIIHQSLVRLYYVVIFSKTVSVYTLSHTNKHSVVVNIVWIMDILLEMYSESTVGIVAVTIFIVNISTYIVLYIRSAYINNK